MKWKLLFKLSLLGLVMAFGTISLIPDKIEPLFWLVIFSVCAYLIAVNCRNKYFLHGFMLSLLNSVWITVAHFIFFGAYATHRPEVVKMFGNMPVAQSRMLMLVMGPAFGAVFGLFQGLFAFIASKLVKPQKSL